MAIRVEDHLGLVGKIAQKYTGRISFEEAFQAGVMGAMRAAELYDPSRGASFATFAWPHICQRIRREFARAPVVRETETGKRKGLDAPRFVWLDTPIEDLTGNAGPKTGHDYLADENGVDPLEAFEVRDRKRLAQKLLRCLPERDRNVVRLHFLRGRTYDEIASKYGVTRQRIQQILKKSLDRLREVRFSDLAGI